MKEILLLVLGAMFGIMGTYWFIYTKLFKSMEEFKKILELKSKAKYIDECIREHFSADGGNPKWGYLLQPGQEVFLENMGDTLYNYISTSDRILGLMDEIESDLPMVHENPRSNKMFFRMRSIQRFLNRYMDEKAQMNRNEETLNRFLQSKKEYLRDISWKLHDTNSLYNLFEENGIKMEQWILDTFLDYQNRRRHLQKIIRKFIEENGRYHYMKDRNNGKKK